MKWIERFKDWATRAPPPPGPLPNGPLNKSLNAENAVIIVVDSNGHVYEVNNASINGGSFQRVITPRKALENLFVRFNVRPDDQQIPNVSVERNYDAP